MESTSTKSSLCRIFKKLAELSSVGDAKERHTHTYSFGHEANTHRAGSAPAVLLTSVGYNNNISLKGQFLLQSHV